MAKIDETLIEITAKAGYEARVGEYAAKQPWESLTPLGHEVEKAHYRAAVAAYLTAFERRPQSLGARVRQLVEGFNGVAYNQLAESVIRAVEDADAE